MTSSEGDLLPTETRPDQRKELRLKRVPRKELSAFKLKRGSNEALEAHVCFRGELVTCVGRPSGNDARGAMYIPAASCLMGSSLRW